MSATWTAAAAPSRRVAAAVCLCLVGGSHALQSKPVVSPASIRPAIHPATAVSVSDELHAAAVALLDSDEAGECDTTAVSTAGITAVPGHPSSPEAGGASSSNRNAARFALAAVAATYGSNYGLTRASSCSTSGSTSPPSPRCSASRSPSRPCSPRWPTAARGMPLLSSVVYRTEHDTGKGRH